jgi:rare lipoprotein A (peptidoglycan hydrolase)
MIRLALIASIILAVAFPAEARRYHHVRHHYHHRHAKHHYHHQRVRYVYKRGERIGRAYCAVLHRHATGALHCHAWGKTSWYGGGEKLNRHTANGEVFRPMGFTAAHRTLPMGTKIRVRYRNRSVIVRVNDRGPAAWTGRDLDLSQGAARVLGIIPQGVAAVQYDILTPVADQVLAPVFKPILQGIDDAIQGR